MNALHAVALIHDLCMRQKQNDHFMQSLLKCINLTNKKTFNKIKHAKYYTMVCFVSKSGIYRYHYELGRYTYTEEDFESFTFEIGRCPNCVPDYRYSLDALIIWKHGTYITHTYYHNGWCSLPVAKELFECLQRKKLTQQAQDFLLTQEVYNTMLDVAK